MNSEYAAFIDFETTGLDVRTDNAVEFAALIYDPASRRYVKTFEEFLSAPEDEKSLALIESISLIKPEYAHLFHTGDCRGFREFLGFIRSRHIKWLVAHNAPFDKGFFIKVCQLLGEPVPDVRWIDSMVDYPFRDGIKPKALFYLCADHSFVNPFPHRAIADCLALYGITKQYEWADILAYADLPTVRYRAMTSYDEREKAKAQGFRWDDTRKIWWIESKDTAEFRERMKNFDFTVRPMA